VLLNQQVFVFNLLAAGVFLRRIKVFDDFKHVGKRWQVKHQHHHALDAGGNAKLVGGVAQVVQKVAVKKRFALLGQAERVINFVARVAWHHAAQKLHVGRGYLHVHHKVGARKAEQHEQIVLPKQCRINFQFTRRVVQYRQGKREFVKPIDQLTHYVGTLVAEKQTGEYLDLKIGA